MRIKGGERGEGRGARKRLSVTFFPPLIIGGKGRGGLNGGPCIRGKLINEKEF